ncbi:hypothetical protein KVV02_004364 [Mortierella alpina]|uniref:Coiled-coil domain-containing protein 130 n=1 Tax=Mortierella alpina TaxID=64518 RepID=A0A9P8A110_MORAP|nr:hypothetical protein KVV02_004364 [Mortierella alpina]
MADRKATNKYYPPDWDPSKGSINSYVGQHPLRDRARKLDQGILIVRFELPYNIWCNGCNNPIGMGVRYNAEKKKIGNYYSTAILSFRMKCHLCDNWFEIQTDPKNAAYVVTAGARKKVEDFDAKDNETLEIDTPEEFERRANDKFARLEHERIDAGRAQTGTTALTRLQRLNERQWSDPYALSQKLRKEFRTEKKARQKEDAECKSIADRVGFAFSILPESEEDRSGSKRIEFESGQKTMMELRLKAIKSGGLFAAERHRKGANGCAVVKSQVGVQPSNSTNMVLDTLAATVSSNTRLQVDPFLNASSAGRAKASGISSTPSLTLQLKTAVKLPLVSYGADEDDEDDEDGDNDNNH